MEQKRVINRDVVSWGRASDFSGGSLRNCHKEESQELSILRDENKYHKLQYFQACLFATILEDVIPQLWILDASNNSLRIDKTLFEMDVLLRNKFDVKKSNENEVDALDLKTVNGLKHKLDKLQADRNCVLQVLSETYRNLCIARDFQCLTDYVNQIIQREEHMNHIIEEERKNKVLCRDSHRQLRQLRNHIKSICYDTNSEIDFLRSKVEDADLNACIRERYVDGWQRARTEQHLQKICIKEATPKKAIKKFKQRVEQEQRVHSEIELLTTLKINELLENVEEAMVKYEKDMESMDLKIQLMRNDYENMQTKNENLEETIKEHAELIKNWIDFKNEREATRKYNEKMTNSAIIVQAWWRGLLVRNQLGPYKPIKKRGASAKPNEKTKKKKN